MAALVNGIGDIFYSFYHKGTANLNNPLMIAQEVIDALPSLYRVSFMVIHSYAGERLVYGYLYNNKLYGTINITSYQGVSYVFDVVNGEIKSR